MPVVYQELRRLAAFHLPAERRTQTLQPTAVVNEAYLLLVDQHGKELHSREHFLAVASQAMRQVLFRARPQTQLPEARRQMGPHELRSRRLLRPDRGDSI